MEIELKNGEKIILEVTPLTLEYFEDYEYGIEQLIKDSQGEKDETGRTRRMYAVNQLLYSIIASNYDNPLTYRQAVKLVKLEDIDKILDFIIKSVPLNNTMESKETTKFKHRI